MPGLLLWHSPKGQQPGATPPGRTALPYRGGPNIRSRRPYGGRARKRPRSRPLLTAVGHTAVGHIKYTPRPAPPPALIRSSHCAIRSRP